VLVFFDSSALAKLVVDEPGSDTAARLWDEADAVVASRLVEPEVSAALHAAARASRLTSAQLRQAEDSWQEFSAGLRKIELTSVIARTAAHLTGSYALGGADAVHLASVLALRETGPVLAAWDGRLRAAAAATGLRLGPAEV